MRTACRFLGSLVVPAVFLMFTHAAPLLPQTHNQGRFDISRMAQSEGMFETFHVTETQSLRQALEAGILKEDTPVLVTKTAAGHLALLIDQMSFHHIAQGQAEGKPWTATF